LRHIGLLVVLTSLGPCLARLRLRLLLLLGELSLVAFIEHLHDVLGTVESPHQHAENLLLRLWSTSAKPLLKTLVLTLKKLNSFKQFFLFVSVEAGWWSLLLLNVDSWCLVVRLVLPFLLVGFELSLEFFQLHEFFLHQDTKLVVFQLNSVSLSLNLCQLGLDVSDLAIFLLNHVDLALQVVDLGDHVDVALIQVFVHLGKLAVAS